MRTFIIHRTVPGAGQMDAAHLAGLATRSNQVLADLGPKIQWVHSYVTDDTITCIYRADSSQLILEHGRCGGFPVDSVTEVTEVIDPTTATAAS